MNPGDVVLTRMYSAAGTPSKTRPVLVLAFLPGSYQTVLVCGISSQLHLLQTDWDEVLRPGDADYQSSGLHVASAIRPSYIRSVQPVEILGAIGRIEPSRLDRIRQRLADHLRP